MKNLIVISVLYFLTLPALARETVTSGVTATSQTSGPTLFERPIQNVLKEMRSAAFDSPSCGKFILKDGTFGTDGETVAKSIETIQDLKFLVSPQVATGELLDVCPGLTKMDELQKKAFWIWTIGQLANYETICGKSPAKVSSAGFSKNIGYESQFALNPALTRGHGPLCDQSLRDSVADIQCVMKMTRDLLLKDDKRSLFSSNAWTPALKPSSTMKRSTGTVVPVSTKLKKSLQQFLLCLVQ